MHRVSLLPLALVLSVQQTTAAQVIHVPGDYDDLQVAIDSVPSGATILVGSGLPWGSIVITKPLTLVGGSYEGTIGGHTPPYITLAGPGHGKVVLSNIHAELRLFGFLYGSVGPGVEGGGFDELHIYDSHIRAAEIRPTDGRAFGMPAVSTSVPLIVVERSSLEGSRTDDSEITFGPGHEGPPGVDAPGSTLVILDSTIRGGASGYFTMAPESGWICQDVCSFGRGGPGAVAASVYSAGSTLAGGQGASYSALLFENGPYGDCPCTAPDGKALISGARAVLIPSTLKMPSPPRIGSTLSLSYSGASSGALLLSFGFSLPSSVPGLGLLFLAPPQLPAGVLPPGESTFLVPSLPILIGRLTVLQVVDPLAGLSRPVAGVVR